MTVRICGLALGLSVIGCAVPNVEEIRQQDLIGAAAAFQTNIGAIHQQDTEGYLSSYLNSPDFVVAGPDSIARGFIRFAEERRADSEWPDTLIAGVPTLVWIAPGVVYGAYPYTVVIAGDTSSGWSERIFLKTGGSWKIAVTSVIPRTENP